MPSSGLSFSSVWLKSKYALLFGAILYSSLESFFNFDINVDLFGMLNATLNRLKGEALGLQVIPFHNWEAVSLIP